MKKERLLSFAFPNKYIKKKNPLLFPAQLPTNFQQRITRYGALSKPSKSGAGSPLLSSKTDPSFRLVNHPPFTLNIGQTELSSTSIASNVDTRYFRQNFPPPSSPRHTRFEGKLFWTRTLAAATLLNTPLKRDAGRFMAGPSLRFRHVSSWNLCPPRGSARFQCAPRSNSIEKGLPSVNCERESLEWIKLKGVSRIWRNLKKHVSPLFLFF